MEALIALGSPSQLFCLAHHLLCAPRPSRTLPSPPGFSTFCWERLDPCLSMSPTCPRIEPEGPKPRFCQHLLWNKSGHKSHPETGTSPGGQNASTRLKADVTRTVLSKNHVRLWLFWELLLTFLFAMKSFKFFHIHFSLYFCLSFLLLPHPTFWGN